MNEPDADCVTIALTALAWTMSDERRAQRLLDVTGLTVDGLRARAGDPALLSALVDFLEAHEPDLIACADAIGEQPTAIVAAGRRLAA